MTTKGTDAQALALAMEIASRDPEMADQLHTKLHGIRLEQGRGWACPPERWEKVAEFAASSLQTRNLKLRPWETAPCDADGEGDTPADVLLRKMLKAGISRWHHSPLEALAEAQEEHADA